ncbi:MAG: hypothetical protein R2697_13675 [Ilumatobacteraceae bacterium]
MGGVQLGVRAQHDDRFGRQSGAAGDTGRRQRGAIALDGNRYTLLVSGSTMTDNVANEGGGAIFFVSNNRTGSMHIDRSVLRHNPSLGFETRGYPGIFYLGNGPIQTTASTIE